MERCLLLCRVLIFLSMVSTIARCCNPAISIAGVDAIPLPAGEECTTDNQCHDGKFCNTESVHPKKYCSPCQDCSNWNRRDKFGVKCFKRQSDCGGCIDNYSEDVDGSCQPNELGGHGKQSASASAESSSQSMTKYIIIGLVAVVILGGLILIVVKKDVFSKSPQTRDDETELEGLNGETDRSHQDGKGRTPAVPSAPNPEYERPPPYYLACNDYRILNEREQGVQNMVYHMMADPNNPGNGAGNNWIDEDGLPVRPDQVDPQGEPLNHQQAVGAPPEDEMTEDGADEDEYPPMEEVGLGDVNEALGDNPDQDEHMEDQDALGPLVPLPGHIVFGRNGRVPEPRRSSHPFNPEETSLNLSALTDPPEHSSNASRHSSVLSFADSGTGTGGEEENSMDYSMFSRMVPGNLAEAAEEASFYEDEDFVLEEEQ